MPSVPLVMDARELSLAQQEAMTRMRQVVRQDDPNTNATQSLDSHIQDLRTLLD